MPEKFKFKTNELAAGGEIPMDVEELEIDCRIIGKNVFKDRTDLRSVTLVNTEVISEEAFLNCSSLKKLELPDTLRVIGDCAFAGTGIRHLTIPPSVIRLGWSIIPSSDKTENCGVLEICLNDKGIAPFFDGLAHLAGKTRIIARSADTKDVLCEFITFQVLEDVLTKDGIDFTRYDQKLFDILKTKEFNYYSVELEAARTRINNPAYMREDTAAELYSMFGKAIGSLLDILIRREYRYDINEIESFPCLGYIGGEKLSDIILTYTKKLAPKTIKKLLTLLCAKSNDLCGSNAEALMKITDISVRFGMIDETARLMQRFHEITADRAGAPDDTI